MFVKRGMDGTSPFILIKLSDEFLFAGPIEVMKEFMEVFKKRFELSKAIMNSEINFNGWKLSQDDHRNINMSMSDHVASIQSLIVSKDRRRKADEKASLKEYTDYRSLAGSIFWAGHGTPPQASLLGSFMQQNAPYLRVRYSTEANRMVKEVRDLDQKYDTAN